MAKLLALLKAIDEFIKNVYHDPIDTPVSTLSMNQPTPSEVIYATAKGLIGQRLTLDSTVPFELGCAEAISTVLKAAGVKGIPITGFQGTNTFEAWLIGNFESISVPEVGCIIISPTSPSFHGHIGIFAKYGILSNNSYTGRFDEHISWAAWLDFYSKRGGLETLYFQWRG